MADIERYLNGIESQHIAKPKFMAHLTALLKKADDVTSLVTDMPRLFSTKVATGAQLDLLGALIGADRKFSVSSPSLDDDTYRKIILTRIVQNQWNGTNGSFRDIWDAAVGSELGATFYDNQDMTMDIQLTGSTEADMIEMILRGYIIPKPAGVGLNVELTDTAVWENGSMAAAAKVSAVTFSTSITVQ